MWNSHGKKFEAPDSSIVIQDTLRSRALGNRDLKTKENASNGVNCETCFFLPVVNGCTAGFFFDLLLRPYYLSVFISQYLKGES